MRGLSILRLLKLLRNAAVLFTFFSQKTSPEKRSKDVTVLGLLNIEIKKLNETFQSVISCFQEMRWTTFTFWLPISSANDQKQTPR